MKNVVAKQSICNISGEHIMTNGTYVTLTITSTNGFDWSDNSWDNCRGEKYIAFANVYEDQNAHLLIVWNSLQCRLSGQ